MAVFSPNQKRRKTKEQCTYKIIHPQPKKHIETSKKLFQSDHNKANNYTFLSNVSCSILSTLNVKA